MRNGFFVYPWDLLAAEPEQVLPLMAERYACTTIALNANYHSARLLRPNADGPKTWQTPGAAAAFVPRAECYPDTPLRPQPDRRLVESDVLARARQVAGQLELDFALWTVGLHNSTLGERHPELCMENCFGDRYHYALCPSNRPVQAYLAGLLRDLCRQFQPDRIIQEAIGYLGLRHWVHHELFMTAWDETLELLLSLCFCPACLERAGEAGLDGLALRGRVAALAERLLQMERGQLATSFTAGEPASLLAEIPGLATFAARRAATVTALVADLSAVAHEHGVALEVIPASFHRPLSHAWLEGAALDDLGAASDGLLVPSYFDSSAEVAADLAWAGLAAPGRSLSAGLNACAPFEGGAAGLSAQLAACRRLDCRAVYVYNYGMLTERRLDWVEQAFGAERGDGSA